MDRERLIERLPTSELLYILLRYPARQADIIRWGYGCSFNLIRRELGHRGVVVPSGAIVENKGGEGD